MMLLSVTTSVNSHCAIGASYSIMHHQSYNCALWAKGFMCVNVQTTWD